VSFLFKNLSEKAGKILLAWSRSGRVKQLHKVRKPLHGSNFDWGEWEVMAFYTAE
jgi:hypothetical protein